MLTILATWWFWLVLVEIVFVFAVLSYEKTWAANLSLLVFLGLLYWPGGVNVFGYIIDNPWNTTLMALAYFPIGAGWATLKWFLFVLDQKNEYKEFKGKFFETNGLKGLKTTTPMNQTSVDSGLFTEELLEKWEEYLHNRYTPYRKNDLSSIPQARNHKYRILEWIGYWPFSVIHTLLSDFVKRISRAIYNMIQGWFQAISNKIYADMKADFE
jgi:hypothetical protein